MDIIKRADDHSVRAVLLYLCNDMQNRAKALSLLANLEKAQNVQIQPAASSAGRPKRKATKHLWVCVRCDDVFDEDNNGDQGCQFHDGINAFPDPSHALIAFYIASQASQMPFR